MPPAQSIFTSTILVLAFKPIYSKASAAAFWSVTLLKLAGSGTSPQMPVTGPSLAFDSLGLDFWIGPRGVSIAGHCAGLPGAVAVGGGRALLTEPTAQPQPVAALIQALVPVHEGRLARLLPDATAGKMN